MHVSSLSTKFFTPFNFVNKRTQLAAFKPALQALRSTAQTSTLKDSKLTKKIELQSDDNVISSKILAKMISNKVNIQQHFFDCIKNKDVASIKLLINVVGADAKDKYGRPALDWAIDYSNEIVDLLLSHGAKVEDIPKDSYIYPLWERACQCNSINLLTRLLESKICSVNTKDSKGNTPLKLAIQYKNIQLVEMLLKHGAKPTFDLISYLLNIYTYHTENILPILSKLLDNGFDVNAVFPDGFSLLHKCIQPKDSSLVAEVLKRGANIDVECNGISPLYYALEQRWVAGFDLLLTRGVKPKTLSEKEIEIINNRFTYSCNLDIINSLKKHDPQIEHVINELIRKQTADKIKGLEDKIENLKTENSQLRDEMKKPSRLLWNKMKNRINFHNRFE